ncbi:MAG: c-type cytochrome [Chloroflexota bacterium]|nr:c-type cytochrome [Chloroflexota bacterium]
MTENRQNGDSSPGFVPILILLVVFGVALWFMLGNLRQTVVITTPEPTLAPTAVAVVPTATPAAVTVAYLPEAIDNGRNTFLTSCAACHGQNAQGIQGLGKNLIVSDFVTGLTDEELVQFVIEGRTPDHPLNTTGMPMPARGGNPALTDEAIMDIVAYLRSSAAEQDLGVVGGGVAPQPAPEVPVVLEPFTLPGPVAAAASYSARAVAPYRPVYTVQETYNLSCAGCHGYNGEGVEDYTASLFESDLWGDGAALLAFLSADTPPGNPEAGFPHPTQGNLYPQMTDPELLELIGYLYTLNP